MCKGCWEDSGSPAIVNEKTIKGAKLVNNIYETENGGAGGLAHCAFDDWNLNGSLEWDINNAKNTNIEDLDWCQETKDASIEALEYFQKLSIPERYSALAIHHGFIKI